MSSMQERLRDEYDIMNIVGSMEIEGANVILYETDDIGLYSYELYENITWRCCVDEEE